MKRLAIFVEGQTELYFTQKLIEEMAGYGKITFDLKVLRSGVIHDLRSVGPALENAEINIMIVDCGGDGSVKSAILERKGRLISAGYSSIIGLLDLFPKQLDELEKYKAGLAAGLDDENITIKIFIAVKEIESWFLNEHTHFLKISNVLTPCKIEELCGFNPASGCAEKEVHHPAVIIKRIYQFAGSDYRKKEKDTLRIISHLDFSEIYLSVREKSDSLAQFIEGVENFMNIMTFHKIPQAHPTA